MEPVGPFSAPGVIAWPPPDDREALGGQTDDALKLTEQLDFHNGVRFKHAVKAL